MSSFYAEGDYYSLERSAGDLVPTPVERTVIATDDPRTALGMRHFFLSDRWVVVRLQGDVDAGGQLVRAMSRYGTSCGIHVLSMEDRWHLSPFGTCAAGLPQETSPVGVTYHIADVRMSLSQFYVDDQPVDWREARRIMYDRSPEARQAARKSWTPFLVGAIIADAGMLALLTAFADVAIIGPSAEDLGIRNDVGREAALLTLFGVAAVGGGAAILIKVGPPRRNALLAYQAETSAPGPHESATPE